jgi:hypothetical protein
VPRASAEPPNLIHPTYRHLRRSIRLAGLTLGQWAQLVGGGVGAWVLAHVLPFSTSYNLSLAVTAVGVPVAVSLAGGAGAVDPFAYARAFARWRRRAAVHLPGDASADSSIGYTLVPDDVARVSEPRTPAPPPTAELWT